MKAFFAIVFLYGAVLYAQGNNTMVFNVSGDTSITADEIIVEITVSKIDSSSIETANMVHSSLGGVLKVLDNYGYTKGSIFFISSNQQNYYGRPKEFISTQVYRIILTKFDLFDQLKEDLVKAGATGIRVVAFWSTEYNQTRKSLYSKAIASANERAKYFVSEIGGKTFHITSLTDDSREQSINQYLTSSNNFESNGMVAIQAQRSFAAPTITTGRINLSVSMKISYEYAF